MTKNVLEWLESTAKEHPLKVAYQQDGNQVTFEQVREKAQNIGSALANVEGNAPIAVISGRKIETIISFLGVVYSGHAYAPIDGKLPRHRVELILSLLQPSAILADSENLILAKELAGQIPVFEAEKIIDTEPELEKLCEIREKMVMTDPLYVIFTSGSTGRPKGVITSHQSLMCYIESYADVMEINGEDCLGNQSPLDYIAAIRDIYLPLYRACASVIIPKEYFMEPNKLFEFMNQYKVTSVGWSVSAFTVLLALGSFEEMGLTTLKKVCFSGSVMPSSCLAVWQNNLPGAKFVNQYGPTEATASCTYHVIDHVVEQDEKIPIGKPYKHYKVFLLNRDMTETKAGEVGEICVAGPILALGYYNDLNKTEESFIINPNCKGYPERIYRTGDYGRYREDGVLEYHGRMDRQIKHMGHRVELDEIEYAVGQVQGVDECAVIYDAEREVLKLFYAGTVEKRSLILEIRKILPGFMVPRKVTQLEKLPKLASGKIDMNVLKENM